MQDSPAAVQFIDKLLQEKGVEGVDEEVRLQLRNDLLRRLEDQVNRAIVDSLSPEQLAKFEHLIDAKQIDEIQPFLYNSGVNVQGIVARCMSEFHASYLEA
jgi:hypothetical protein